MARGATLQSVAGRQSEARRLLGLTQHELSEKLDVPLRTIADNERGVSNPGTKVLTAYARAGVSINWMLLGIGEPLLESTVVEQEEKTDSPVVEDKSRIVAIPLIGSKNPMRDLAKLEAQENLPACIHLDHSFARDLTNDGPARSKSNTVLASMRIADHTMEPEYPKGCLVVFQGSSRERIRDAAYILRRGSKLCLRRLQPIDRRSIAICKGNPAGEIESVETASEIEIVGRVLAKLTVS